MGREEELAGLRRLLDSARLVTVTGVGGVGKTRIAVRAAAGMRRSFPDGVWFVELSGLREAELLAHAVANALGVPDQSTRPQIDVLADWVEKRRLLLILDTCEHLLDACAMLAETLLRAAPGLRVLATSRQPLDVPGEHTLALAPLPVPDPEHQTPSLTGSPSLALFAERVAAVVPGFTLDERNIRSVAALCHRLDGIPLAIELAAVRRRALSVEQILARLDDRFRLLARGSRTSFPRHQTLRTAIAWSHELCEPEEQVLWARLSVFARCFDLDAAEEVCSGPDLPAESVCTYLAGLVDKSIVVCEEDADGVRYRLLDVIREYGAERLRDLGEEHRIRRRHRDHFLRRAREIDRAWAGPGQHELLTWLNHNHANLRVALELCASDPEEADAGLGIAGSLWALWIPAGHLREGRRWTELMLALTDAPTPNRVRALWLCGLIAVLQGDIERGTRALAELRPLAACHPGGASFQPFLDHLEGMAAGFGGDPVRGVEAFSRAVETYPSVEGEAAAPGRLTVQAMLSLMLCVNGDVDRAFAVLRGLLEECDRLGEEWSRAYGESVHGFVLLSMGRAEEGEAVARSALATFWSFRDAVGMAAVLDVLAWIAFATGDHERFAVLLGAGRQAWSSFGHQLFSWDVLLAIRADCEARAREEIGDDAFEAACRKGAEMRREEAVAYALSLDPEPPPVDDEDPLAPLTPREREIALLVAEGLSNREIAERLVIAKRTADSHVEHILTKLGFSTRAQIAAWVAARRR
ncbi:LuxR family transcriptional regulator [Bailinhaonella thermotolerans]|uniref:LuxR family transcriptional regulator n=1 Tax=Bailinhaonella thermotolerans TaxID=1070861 RepID=A0A3A4B0N9_9ACTN|nr:LuxR family transcriptional regulator [Bailinhaonella thermotolerans]